MKRHRIVGWNYSVHKKTYRDQKIIRLRIFGITKCTLEHTSYESTSYNKRILNCSLYDVKYNNKTNYEIKIIFFSFSWMWVLLFCPLRCVLYVFLIFQKLKKVICSIGSITTCKQWPLFLRSNASFAKTEFIWTRKMFFHYCKFHSKQIRF